MKKRMKKRGIIISIIIFIILLIVGISCFVKEGWRETMSDFGPLNIIETDDIGTINENKSISYFTLSGKSDYYLSGSVTVKKGTASCIITCDGTKIYEENFSTGNNQIKTDVFKNKTGEICIEISASDDVEGDYNIILHTRESVFIHTIRRLKEFF